MKNNNNIITVTNRLVRSSDVNLVLNLGCRVSGHRNFLFHQRIYFRFSGTNSDFSAKKFRSLFSHQSSTHKIFVSHHRFPTYLLCKIAYANTPNIPRPVHDPLLLRYDPASATPMTPAKNLGVVTRQPPGLTHLWCGRRTF